ncbi:hypothetical protein KVP09_15540 [Alcaligenaceae bacterium CGII-47]|nr:hypothetical protein [Alcaligenaceae bacterium CGII-47]
MEKSLQGMLLSTVDIAAVDEADFNDWSDQEHVLERVAIPGFLDGRRYRCASSKPHYLSLYRTATFGVLDSAEYRHALANQTSWSLKNFARFLASHRVVAPITVRHGMTNGAYLSLVRFRPEARSDATRQALDAALNACLKFHGVLCAYLLEADPVLSKPIGAIEPPAGSGDWYLIVEGIHPSAVSAAANTLNQAEIGGHGEVLSAARYDLISYYSRLDAS